jgi:hypothetical protein
MGYTPEPVARQEIVQPTANYNSLGQFACFPNAVLRDPPIRHRGADPNTGLAVFEFSIAGAILMWARSHELKSKRHVLAFQTGQRRIKEFRPKGTRYKRQSDRSFDSFRHTQYKVAGESAYDKAYQEFTVEKPLGSKVARTELLRAAGVAGHPSSANLQRLDAALSRLTKPIVPDVQPLLREIKPLSYGKLRLAIDATWLPSKGYGKVLWPPPKNGATALALLLFIAGCNLRSKISIPLDALYKRVGLTQSRPSHRKRGLRQALDVVNRHLARTNAELDPEDWPRKIKINYLWVGKVCHVRFVAVDSAKVKARQRASAEYEAEAKRRHKIDERIRKEDEEAKRYFSQKRRDWDDDGGLIDYEDDDYD